MPDHLTPPTRVPGPARFLADISLRAYFALFAGFCGAPFGAVQYLLGANVWFALVMGVVFGLLMGAVFTRIESRQRQRGDVDERTRYRAALNGGELSENVGPWLTWIERDERMNRISGVTWVVLVLLVGLAALASGPTWTTGLFALLAPVAFYSWLRARRQFHALRARIEAGAR